MGPEMARKFVDEAGRRNILIFNTNLLSYSETFIPAQAEQFTRFVPYYSGFGRTFGGRLPDERTFWPQVPPWRVKLREWGSVFGLLDPAWANAMRQVAPKLIHAHFEFGGIRILPLAEKLNVPLVTTCHGVDVTEEFHQWKNRAWLGDFYLGRRQRFFDKAAVNLGVSRFICDQMLKRGYAPEKVRLHYIGVDIEKFRPNPTVPKEPVILYVGRLVEKKGSPDLLQAMKQVNAKYPDVKLVVIGDGALRTRLETYARDEKLNVDFRGIQPPEVVQQTLQSALMFCMPSVRAANGDSEGLGIVNLEAQAVGVPVIGTWHGGIPEAVEHGVTGLLAPERSPEILAENILTLLGDAPLREKMGLAARERVTRLFDLKQQSGILEDIYESLL
jgi:glycosyltransferase involved in cell wall biosynthesis